MPAESLFITGGAGMLESERKQIPPPTILEESGWLDNGKNEEPLIATTIAQEETAEQLS
jgi:hypothetical protein